MKRLQKWGDIAALGHSAALVAGILSVLALTELTAVYGLGLIIWLIWLGADLLRHPGRAA